MVWSDGSTRPGARRRGRARRERCTRARHARPRPHARGIRRRDAGRRPRGVARRDQGGPRPTRGRVRARAHRPLRLARARPDRAHLRVIVSTYSIVACDLEAAQWAVAVQSKFLAVGSVVPWAEPAVGAIATQAYANARYGLDGLVLLREGLGADDVVQRLVAADDGRNERQLGVVDAHGNAASYTGSECLDWAGHRTGHCYAAQGNILVGPETVAALADTFEATAGQS